MSDPLVVEVLAGAVAGGTCILYASVGESFSESAGVVNLGTEGSMLCGAGVFWADMDLVSLAAVLFGRGKSPRNSFRPT